MNKAALALPLALAFAAPSLAFAQAAAAPANAAPNFPPELSDYQAQNGYALGLSLGRQFKRDGAAVDPNALTRGMRDAMSDAKPLLTDAQVHAIMIRMQADIQQHREAKASEDAKANEAAGLAFLAANKTKPGVVTLESGLQYQILKAGDGPKPKLTDTVQCNYRGTLIDGTEFDSSDANGGPVSFPVSGVIKGWTQALQLMPVGSKWRLFVPATLAYGETGAGGKIGPNSVLIFDVELLSAKPG
jgi:FKBP-type peptidyl-prolyl cis-trans isomerase FklB